MPPAPDERDRALYIISVAAELAGVHAQTLRIYERKGLIEPQRTEGGSRRYSDRDIALLRRIQELTNDGVSLAGVRKVLELERDLGRAHARIRELQRAVDQARDDLVEAVEAAHRQHRRDLVLAPRPAVPARRRIG
jgi:MerR family transcriptional regulator/heat shock protein HspR